MNRKEQIIQLWRCCFEDSEDFIRRFFSQVYREENALTLEHDGQIVCAMQLLPYTISYYGQAVPATYIYGVCTHPDYRRRGYMHQLLETAFARLKEQGSGLAFLIPAHDWLFDCYRKSGFTEAFGCTCRTLSLPEVPLSPVAGVEEVKETDIPACWDYLTRKWKEMPVAVLHSLPDFQFVFRDVEAGGGKSFLYRKAGKVEGMLMAVPVEEKLFLPELQADTEQVGDVLITAAASTFQRKEVNYRLPGKTARYGMARVISPELLFPYWNEKQAGNSLPADTWKSWSAEEQTVRLLDGTESSGYMSLMMD